MLELAIRPSDPKAAEIVTKHVNGRLLQIIREIIYDYAVYERAMDEVEKKIRSGEIKVDPNDRIAHLPQLPHISKLDDIVDFGELLYDDGFAENVSRLYLPKYYYSRPAMDANHEFISLYKLIRAKGEYTPELPMQYILYQLICSTADFLADMDEFQDEDEEPASIERIPEPDRSYVISKMRPALDPEFSAEDFLRHFEDLAEYEETCFADIDFAMLDYADEKSLRSAPFASYIGLQDEQGITTMDISVGGKYIQTKFKIEPWEIEEY